MPDNEICSGFASDGLVTSTGRDDDEWLLAARAEMRKLAARWPVEAADQTPADQLVAFDAHVTPTLEALGRGYAAFVRLGWVTLSDAHGAVMGLAVARGAGGFSPEALAQVSNWCLDHLLRSIGEVD